MKNFLVGLVIGLPVGMLLGDTFLSGRGQWQERAREWMSSAREGVQQAEQRIREVVEGDLREMPGNVGRNLADLVDREATQARQSAGASTEHTVLNSVGRDELLAVYGIGPVLADRILKGRPYHSDHEVVERGIINETVFAQLQRQVLQKHERPA